MAEETKKDEDAETVPEAPATGADAPETAGADVVPEGESAVPAGNEDAGLDPVEALIAERDSLKDQLLRALADVENMRRRT
ncbi:MAG: nucleotide exchange factor GrpE, partial [Pseudomonadota bacterium]|nr:nucleotide exchange factor GrpE [Pseudomonadota bacterium]